MAEERPREQENKEHNERFKNQMLIHRETMNNLQNILDEKGATVTDAKEFPTGTEIDFEMNGLKFKLKGWV